MSNVHDKQKTTEKELEDLIEAAIKKIGGKKENDICRFIPNGVTGYIHHFTMRKMKHEDPAQLAEMIKRFIVESSKPQSVPPKQRAARGSRKRHGQFLFSKDDIERMLHMARLAGDKEMIRKLTPRKDLRQLKKELIASIKRGEVDHELWNCYTEAAATHAAAAIAIETHA